MRREELYVRDIVEAANHIASFIAGLSPSGFEESELVRSAVVQKLAIIGLAAARVSDELAASRQAPELRDQVDSILRAEFGRSEN